MPCMDGGPSPHEEARSARKQAAWFEATLCGVFTFLENQPVKEFFDDVLDNLDYEEMGVDRKEIEAWWQQHKREDAERRAQEARERQTEEARKRGLENSQPKNVKHWDFDMRLPRLTRIHTVDIYLKGGAVIRRDFTELSWKANAEGVTNLKWTCDNDLNFVAVLGEIAAINAVSSRVRFRVRHAA